MRHFQGVYMYCNKKGLLCKLIMQVVWFFFQDPFNLVLLGLIEFLSYYKKQTERKKKDHCLILHDAL